jgi:hypothetical protein
MDQFSFGERGPGTYWIGGSIGLESVWKFDENILLLPGKETDRPTSSALL